MKTSSKILLGLTITGAILCSTDISAQTEKTTKDFKKDIVELFDNPDNTEKHQQIVKSKISDMVEKYGLEKTQELVRIHALLEINKYKQGGTYKTNEVLTKAAQDHANDMSQNNYFRHENMEGNQVWDRVNKIGGYDYQSISENISFRDNIEDVIIGYTKGQFTKHDEIFSGEYEDIGIGISIVQNPKWKGRGMYYFVFNFGKKSN